MLSLDLIIVTGQGSHMSKTNRKKSKKKLSFFRVMLHSKGSQSILLSAFSFIFWVLLLSSSILSFGDSAASTSEMTLLSVFRAKFMHADFSSYTFATGLGASIFRLMLCGYGGILTVLSSLLPIKYHPYAVIFLAALRLSIASGIMCRAIRDFSTSEKNRSLPVLAPVFGLLYAFLAFLVSFLCGIAVSETYIFLPLILLLYLQILHHERPAVSGGFFLCICAYFCAQAILSLVFLPVLLILISVLTLKTRKEKIRDVLTRVGAQILLSFGLLSILLIPQLNQIPARFLKENPTSRFLQKLGSDTDDHSCDVTFHSDATAPILEQNASLFIVGKKAPDFELNATYPSHFQFLNEWIYTLWPSLPSIPFQDTSSTTDAAPTPNTRSASTTTLFSDPLYAAITLPNRKSNVTVSLNGRYITDIRHNPGTVLVNLGSYNAGQNLTLTLTCGDPDELADCSISFGHINSMNWNKYTENCTYGIADLQVNNDGITAESAVAYDSLLLTNIPYEKGWSLYLNGQKTPVAAYEQAWVSAPVAQGSYVIHLEYKAPGSFTGSILTALSFLLLAIYYFSKSSPMKSRNT